MAKKAASRRPGFGGNTGAFNWPLPGDKSGTYWSIDRTNGLEIDLSGDVGHIFSHHYVADETEFTIHFDSLAAQVQAHLFFGLAYYSFVQITYLRPDFDTVILALKGQEDRDLVIGVLNGLVYFYFEVHKGEETGILLQLHHPETI